MKPWQMMAMIALVALMLAGAIINAVVFVGAADPVTKASHGIGSVICGYATGISMVAIWVFKIKK